jgi:hypothetical protein
MKVIAALMSLALLATATAAAAQMQQKPPKYEGKKEQARASPLPRGNGYREQLADKLPFGSSAWWDQMKREGRLGGETP